MYAGFSGLVMGRRSYGGLRDRRPRGPADAVVVYSRALPRVNVTALTFARRGQPRPRIEGGRRRQATVAMGRRRALPSARRGGFCGDGIHVAASSRCVADCRCCPHPVPPVRGCGLTALPHHRRCSSTRFGTRDDPALGGPGGPIREGGTAAEAFRRSLDLAQHVERWGYCFWLAEHHNMPGIASAATAVLIAHVAAGTSRIRIGAGGIMIRPTTLRLRAIRTRAPRLRAASTSD